MLTIVIPMAGLGSRFATAGYPQPKPLIPVHGVPMIRLVIDNLRPKSIEHRFIIIVQRDHMDGSGLREQLHEWGGFGTELVEIDGLTDGAARTVLKAKRLIDNDEPLMIANCDQYVDVPMDLYLQRMDDQQLDGLIMTMTATDPKWSFVGFDVQGRVSRVVEKVAISSEATVGIYNYRRGADFVAAAEEMIAQDLRVNNEFYVAPAYNQMISWGRRIGCYNVGSEGQGMYGIGIPADLELFVANEVSLRATKVIR